MDRDQLLIIAERNDSRAVALEVEAAAIMIKSTGQRRAAELFRALMRCFSPNIPFCPCQSAVMLVESYQIGEDDKIMSLSCLVDEGLVQEATWHRPIDSEDRGRTWRAVQITPTQVVDTLLAVYGDEVRRGRVEESKKGECSECRERVWTVCGHTIHFEDDHQLFNLYEICTVCSVVHKSYSETLEDVTTDFPFLPTNRSKE